MSAGICPCCGQAVADGESLVVSLDTNTASRFGRMVALTPMMAETLTALHRRHPAAVGLEGIVLAVYGHGAEPDHVYNSVKAMLTALRRRLEPIGVGIEVRYKAGWRLRFDPDPMAGRVPA